MTYEEHRRALIEYLKVKVELADWHGVSDAANDLRVMEAAPPPVQSREDRNLAAFSRIAERMAAEESRKQQTNYCHIPAESKFIYASEKPRGWWKRFLRWLRIAN